MKQQTKEQWSYIPKSITKRIFVILYVIALAGAVIGVGEWCYLGNIAVVGIVVFCLAIVLRALTHFARDRRSGIGSSNILSTASELIIFLLFLIIIAGWFLSFEILLC